MGDFSLRRIVLRLTFGAIVFWTTPSSGCSFSDHLPCCNLSLGDARAQNWMIAKNRSANTRSVLLKMVASAHGIGESLGIDDLSSTPPGPDLAVLHYRIGLRVGRIFSIDQKRQSYKMKYYLIFKWRDCRALFADSSGITSLFFRDSHPMWPLVWKPTFDIWEKLSEEHETSTSSMKIDPDGLIQYTAVRVTEFSCRFDFAHMPFDEQECVLDISNTADGLENVHVAWDNTIGTGGVEILDDIRPPEWTLGEWKQTDGIPGKRSLAEAVFRLKRQPWFSISNYVIPSILYWLASWLGLWINPDAVPARAAFGVIPVLVMTNKMNNYARALPPISQNTRLQSFMLLSLVVITIQMLEFGLVHTAIRSAASQKLAKANPDDPKHDDLPRHAEAVVPSTTVFERSNNIVCNPSTTVDIDFEFPPLDEKTKIVSVPLDEKKTIDSVHIQQASMSRHSILTAGERALEDRLIRLSRSIDVHARWIFFAVYFLGFVLIWYFS